MEFVRKIKEAAWFELSPEDADSISDLATQNHMLSVWAVDDVKNQDEVNDVALALAMTRSKIEEFYIVLINKEEFNSLFPKNPLYVALEDGVTQYTALVKKHRNFVIPQLWEQYSLSKYIHKKIDENTARFYSYDEIKTIFLNAINAKRINEEDLRDDWKKEYKNHKKELENVQNK